MLTTDPGDSEECYACKLLEVLIIHCHHSLMQVGGAGSHVGGAVTGGGSGSLVGWGRVMDEQSVGMSGVTSQRVGGTTRGRDVVPYGTGHK